MITIKARRSARFYSDSYCLCFEKFHSFFGLSVFVAVRYFVMFAVIDKVRSCLVKIEFYAEFVTVAFYLFYPRKIACACIFV